MRFFLFACICTLTGLTVKAQDYSLTNPEYYVERIPTSPEVAGLGTYGNLPVDKHTGTANVSIPIHTIDFEGLSIPINLAYNTGGIRVGQEATWVGLGWNLNANAVIRRKINGFDDLLDLANASPFLQSKGYIYSPSVNINSSIPNQKLTVSDSTMISNSYSNRQALDMEPDLFTVSLFGRSYSFTLSKWDGNSEFIYGINHDNAELVIRYYVDDQRFEIVDAHGFTYYFDSKERSDPYRSQENPFYLPDLGGSPNIENEVLARDQVGVIAIDLSKVRNAIMSFHLDSISSPFKRKLHFEYEDGLYFTYPNYSHSITINPNGGGANAKQVYSYTGNVTNSFSVGCNITVIKAKYLKRIHGDFGEVEFELENRDDLYNWEIHDEITGFLHPNALPNASLGTIYATKQRRLSKIIVQNRVGEQIKLANLHYSYFNADKISDAEPERYLRLKLDKVEIDDRDYHFDYLYENSLPAKDSPSVDFWGFYNGETNIGNNNKVLRAPSFGRYVRYSPGAGAPKADNKYVIYEGATRSSNFKYGKIGLLKTVYHPTKGRTEFEYEGNRVTVETPTNPGNVHYNSTDYKYSYQYLERAELQKSGGVTINGFFTIQGAGTVPGDNIVVRAVVSCGNYGQGGGNCSTGNPLDLLLITNLNNPSEVYGTMTTNGLSYDSQTSLEGTLSLPNGTYSLSINPQASPVGLSVSITDAYIIDIPPSEDLLVKEYEVGGARINSITDYGSDGQFVSKRTYDYSKYTVTNTLLSSGLLMDELVYHSIYGAFDYTPEGYSDTFFNMGGSGLLNGPGNHIGYTQVTEKKVDSTENQLGSNTSLYYNQPNQHVLRYVGNVPEYGWYNYNNNLGGDNFVSYGNVYYLGLTPNSNAHLNGKLFWETVYNNNDRVVQETINQYSTHEVGITDAAKVYFSGSSLAPIAHYAIYPMYQRVALLDSTVTKQYFNENTATPDIVSSTVIQEYGNKNSLWPSIHFWPTRTTTINSEGENLIKETLYPMQSSGPYMSELIAANRRAQPVEVKVYNGTTFLGEQITEYGPLNVLSDKYKPKNIVTKKEGSSEQQQITYDLYDDYGNLLQYTLNDGTHVSYVWGYDNKLYPVAKVHNAEWVNVQQSLTSGENAELLNSTTSETRMRQLLDKIRAALPDAFVTTYTYKQGVGISTMTDPRGYTTTYGYDGSQRLEKVRDADGNILSDTQYEYKTAVQN
ncbi:RHS repeat domain-containing protein [Flagellimonas sp. HSM57]|uniref:RHS repeat domain-containing protein n=1 Tax=Flagellimonas sp. HSM57 TaxID=2654675 RepID=UPI0013D73962|nr:RHS repeat domain-containing protein [Flagellimonas sp. HSM57]